jgi:cholesterol transport system auxiliary component
MKIFLNLALLLTLGACTSLLPKTAAPPAFYALDAAPGVSAAAAVAASAPTLIVNPPQAAAGFDSSRLIYVRQPHQLQYFSQSEWVDTPARMLAPLLVSALQSSGAFKAVVSMPSGATGAFRLDTEIVRLQQDFDAAGGSTVRFTLRATLLDNLSRKVRGTREFEASVAAGSDAYSGVVAANAAVHTVLADLTKFAAESAR